MRRWNLLAKGTALLPGVICAIALISVGSSRCFSQDRNFARTYQSNIIPKDVIDLEYWNTLRMGKKGDYSPYEFGRILDQRLELEVGLGGNVQTAFYLNVSHSSLLPLGGDAISSSTVTGFSNEWKWKLSDPVADGLGSALYGELSVNGTDVEFEGKVILDKRFGKSLVAFNLTGEAEIEAEAEDGEVEQEGEFPVQLDLGYTYLFSPQFGIGIEATNHNEFTEDGLEHSVLFAGPTIFVASGRVFGILNVQPQIRNLHTSDVAPGNLVLDEHEKIQARLLIGMSL
jgi:hypothetical protein